MTKASSTSEQKRLQEQRRCARNRELINYIKVSRGCADCGYNEYACVLEFDHLPGFKKLFAISDRPNTGKEKLFAEIAKCEVVCANCHRIRTHIGR